MTDPRRAGKSARSGGGLLARNIHQLERVLVKLYDLEGPDDLHRLAIFILAHTLIDELLTGAVIERELSAPSEQDLLSRLKIMLIDQIERRTFVNRLKHAKRQRILSHASFQAAKALNEARNDFIHRYRIPVYKGEKVTRDEGLYGCLADALSIIEDLRADAQRAPGGPARLAR
jgi:hypothetical protein